MKRFNKKIWEPKVNTLAVRVNDFSKRLGAGWAFHIESQRFVVVENPITSLPVKN